MAAQPNEDAPLLREIQESYSSESPLKRHARIRSGLPFSVLEQLRQRYSITRAEAGEALDLSPRTLSRRRSEAKLRPDESDRLYRLARVAALAENVFRDPEKVARWLHRPNRALAGHTPLQLVQSDVGTRQIERVLGRLEHGVFS